MRPERPNLAPGYGIKPATEGRLILWSEVEKKLTSARNYWIATASPQGMPHAAPVWGIWHRGAFHFSTDPQSRKGIHLAANNAIVVHLDSGDDVVVLEGIAERLSTEVSIDELDATYFQKYGFHLQGDSTYRVEPLKVFAWAEADFPSSATRWRFPRRGSRARA
jgi:hypothetical protein